MTHAGEVLLAEFGFAPCDQSHIAPPETKNSAQILYQFASRKTTRATEDGAFWRNAKKEPPCQAERPKRVGYWKASDMYDKPFPFSCK
jgi:hypothetical protein